MKILTATFYLFFCANAWATTIDLKNTDIRVFIDKVSELTGKSFIIDSEVSGVINLSVKSNIDNKELYSLFLSTLKLNNFAAISDGIGFIKIVPISKIKRHLLPSKTKIINLNYARSKDLISVLKSINFKDNNDFIERSLQFDNFTNSIIVSGSNNFINSIQNTIQGLDIKKSQVLIEAIVLEISSSNTKDLGIQWLAQGSNGVGLLNFNNLITSLLSDTPSASLPTGGNVGLGNITNNKGFGVVLSALNSSGNANILSTPSIVTLDNNEAEIIVGQEVPFITTAGINDNSNSFQNFERKDVGLKLKVKPQINNNGDVLLDIEQEMSYLLPSSTASDVITSKRQIKTSVIVNNNQLLVLGGLIDDSFNDTENSVPVLGDLPIIGNFFKQTTKTKEKRNLLVFLRPTILSDEIINDIGNNHSEKIKSIFTPGESRFSNLDKSHSLKRNQSQSAAIESDFLNFEEDY